MVENIRKVGNPLTIIAIFAALAEVAGTIVLGVVPPAIQSIFVWFVMGFPVLLIVLFFGTLIWKADVLYAPSDFADEKNYMELKNRAGGIVAHVRLLGDHVKELQAKLDKQEIDAKPGEIHAVAAQGRDMSDFGRPSVQQPKGSGAATEPGARVESTTDGVALDAEVKSRHEKVQNFHEQLNLIQTMISDVEMEAASVAYSFDPDDKQVTIKTTKARIRGYLSRFGPASLNALCEQTGLLSPARVRLALRILIKEGRVVQVGDDLYADKDWERLAHRAPDREASPMSGI